MNREDRRHWAMVVALIGGKYVLMAAGFFGVLALMEACS